ncbi:UNVERIFIED_CONTAM: hypothetical protein HDU68_003982 [Siphonaria sp. JEL0065]|nr:hypothetical protein HDU68_003982 [Siphonaria sp. JEL0065]
MVAVSIFQANLFWGTKQLTKAGWNFLTGCISASTGLDKDTMEHVFIKYCGPGTIIKTRKYLFDVMQSIKTNTTKQASAKHKGWKSYGLAASKVKLGIMYLGGVVDELEAAWDARWDNKNNIMDGSFDVPFNRAANWPLLTPFQKAYKFC